MQTFQKIDPLVMTSVYRFKILYESNLGWENTWYLAIFLETMTIFAIGWQSTCPWSCQSRPETPTALDTVYILEQLALRTCCLFAELVQNGFCAVCKCFTYVTKTIANLTTMAPLFLRLTSPLDLKFTFFATVKTKVTLLIIVTHLMLSRERLKQ